jgi:hypothetical protein
MPVARARPHCIRKAATTAAIRMGQMGTSRGRYLALKGPAKVSAHKMAIPDRYHHGSRIRSASRLR